MRKIEAITLFIKMNFYIDCPSNFQGKNGKNNIVTNAFFFLKDNESKLLRQMAKSYFSRKRYYFSLAQIMIDEFEPDDEGKILIFRFGKQVYDIIEREKTADPKIKKEAVIPYDPFRGKDFVLWIEEKQIDENRKITSYERSYFDDKLTSMSFDKGEKRVKDTPKNRKLIYEYLKKHSPKLDQCQPKEWDAQTEQRVIASVMSIIGDEKIFDAIYKKTYGKDAVYTPPAKDGDAIEDKTDSKKEVAEETKSEEVKEEVTEETKDNAEKLEDKVAKTTDEKTDAAESKTEETGAAEPEPESTPEPESKEQAGGKPDFDDLDNFDFEKID